MSVTSGVPVFRGSDGTMSPDFLKFLGDFNKVCSFLRLFPLLALFSGHRSPAVTRHLAPCSLLPAAPCCSLLPLGLPPPPARRRWQQLWRLPSPRCLSKLPPASIGRLHSSPISPQVAVGETVSLLDSPLHPY